MLPLSCKIIRGNDVFLQRKPNTEIKCMFIQYIHTRIAEKRLLSWENESAQLGK